MTHADINDDLALFVLGALDPAEIREIETHLRTACAECEQELGQWRAVVALLALADEDVGRPALKASLLERINYRSPRPAADTRRRFGIALPLAAALALALVGLAILRSDLVTLRSEVHTVTSERDQSTQLAASLQAQLAQRNQQVDRLLVQLADHEKDLNQLRSALRQANASLSVLEARNLRLVRLRETADAPPAEAHMLLSEERGRALFYAFDLPAVDTGKTYELWWITEKQGPINAGLFVPDERGLGRVETELPKDAGAIQAAAVTIEPGAGVPKPTGPMVLLGSVTPS